MSVPNKSISAVCNTLSCAKNENTLYIKEKWEREAGIELSKEVWGEIWRFQGSSTCSTDWREHSWKNIIWYFKTPVGIESFLNRV